MVGILLQDLRYGLRMLRNRPGFTLTALVTLALGVGANTVIFSGVYALLLQPLPYANADRLTVVSQTGKQGDEFGVSYSDFTDWQGQNTVFEQMAAGETRGVNLGDGDRVERVAATRVSREFFPLLGGRAALGRTFLAEVFRPGAGQTVVLSHALWQRTRACSAGG
jgi:putative ABC transport system permease protein